jgi:hypothetical protein
MAEGNSSAVESRSFFVRIDAQFALHREKNGSTKPQAVVSGDHCVLVGIRLNCEA